jgi:protein-tyrosine-phosphatase
MAAALLKQAFIAAGRPDVEVTSAGTGAWEGTPASEGSYLVSLEHGVDLSHHRARLLTRELVQEATVILTMSRSHLARVRELGGGGRAHLIGEYAGLDDDVEINDPYGGELEEYRETFRRLQSLLPAVVRRVTESARS